MHRHGLNGNASQHQTMAHSRTHLWRELYYKLPPSAAVPMRMGKGQGKEWCTGHSELGSQQWQWGPDWRVPWPLAHIASCWSSWIRSCPALTHVFSRLRANLAPDFVRTVLGVTIQECECFIQTLLCPDWCTTIRDISFHQTDLCHFKPVKRGQAKRKMFTCSSLSALCCVHVLLFPKV